MFAARLHDPTLPNFGRQEAAELIPKSNPFLRKLFGYVAVYITYNLILIEAAGKRMGTLLNPRIADAPSIFKFAVADLARLLFLPEAIKKGMLLMVDSAPTAAKAPLIAKSSKEPGLAGKSTKNAVAINAVPPPNKTHPAVF